MKKLGIILLVVGICTTLVYGYQYLTREEIAAFGDVRITQNQSPNVDWPLLVGIGILILGGLVLLLSPRKT